MSCLYLRNTFEHRRGIRLYKIWFPEATYNQRLYFPAELQRPLLDNSYLSTTLAYSFIRGVFWDIVPKPRIRTFEFMAETTDDPDLKYIDTKQPNPIFLYYLISLIIYNWWELSRILIYIHTLHIDTHLYDLIMYDIFAHTLINLSFLSFRSTHYRPISVQHLVKLPFPIVLPQL
jgi:hypothetical protein